MTFTLNELNILRYLCEENGEFELAARFRAAVSTWADEERRERYERIRRLWELVRERREERRRIVAAIERSALND